MISETLSASSSNILRQAASKKAEEKHEIAGIRQATRCDVDNSVKSLPEGGREEKLWC